MKFLNVFLAAGVCGLVTASSASEVIQRSATHRHINLESRALFRRMPGEKRAADRATHDSAGRASPSRSKPRQQASQETPKQQLKIKTPPPRTPSPSSSSDRTSGTPRRMSVRAGEGKTSSGGSSAVMSMFPPSPPPRGRFERINPYVAMLGTSKSTIPQSLPGANQGKMSVTQLQTAQSARRDARSARRLATQQYLRAKQISDTRRANSPTTKDAVYESIVASNSAIVSMRKAAQQQSRTATSLIGTVGHHAVDTRLESAARRLARADQLESRNQAFEAQHLARMGAENIQRAPAGRPQYGVIQHTAMLQKSARVQADTYYRDHEDYRELKNLIPGDSSSSDEEHELADYPKTWSSSTRRTNHS